MDVTVLMFFLALGIFYFLPAIIAKMRAHSKFAAITVLNLLLGWTLLGWVIAIVWAFTEKNTKTLNKNQ